MAAQWPQDMLTGKEVSWVVASYCLGCCTAGYYWVRLRTGLDLREQGSGTVGARNAGRLLGPSAFIVTFLVDVAKGALAVAGARFFGLSEEAVICAMLAVVAGHTWPMQLRFQGGKGIATSLGALLVYDSFIVLILICLFLPVRVWLRSFTLSGLLAFALSPLVVFLCGRSNEAAASASFLAILVLLSHRRNICKEIARIFPGRSVKPDPMHTDKGTGP